MAHPLRPCLGILALLVAAAAPLLAQPAVEHDDCESGFIAAVGADAYQFSPEHPGELGSVRRCAWITATPSAMLCARALARPAGLGSSGGGSPGGRSVTVSLMAAMSAGPVASSRPDRERRAESAKRSDDASVISTESVDNCVGNRP